MSSIPALDTPVLDPKDPEERVYVIFAFAKDLDPGETIASITDVVIASGVYDQATAVFTANAALDPDANAMRSGSPALIISAPTKVAQLIIVGLNTVDYRLQARVVTSGGPAGARTLVLACILPVREA